MIPTTCCRNQLRANPFFIVHVDRMRQFPNELSKEEGVTDPHKPPTTVDSSLQPLNVKPNTGAWSTTDNAATSDRAAKSNELTEPTNLGKPTEPARATSDLGDSISDTSSTRAKPASSSITATCISHPHVTDTSGTS